MADSPEHNRLKDLEKENAKLLEKLETLRGSADIDDQCFTRPGAQLAEKQTFRNDKGDSISGYPVIVDFRRLLQLSISSTKDLLEDHGIISGLSNRDLLHAVVGLYDVCLSDMTPDVLYSTVCDKWARTVILIRDQKEILAEMEVKSKTEVKEEEDLDEEALTGSVQSDTACSESKGSELSNDEDVYEPEDEQPSKFAEVFSDTDSEEEEDEEEDDEEDFSKGMNSFIQSVIDRRKARKTHEGNLTEEHIGIENRIIGCATFEKKFVSRKSKRKQKDRVVHLTLVSVRRRCRKFGIGKYLLSQIVDPKVVGHFDAVVVHADNAAVDFFQKFGFSDDIVLNSRWSELAEQFTNCTLMCYLPGFTGHRLLSTVKIPGFEVFELEQEFLKWKEKTVEVYQQQVTCMTRMKHEVLQLKYTTATQNQFLEGLVEDNERLKGQKLFAERELLDYRLLTAKSALTSDDKEEQKADEEDISTQELIFDLQRQVAKMDLRLKHQRSSSRDLDSPKANGSTFTVVDESRYMAYSQAGNQNSGEPYDHIKDSAFFYDVTEQFKQQMRLDKLCSKCEVTTISKALISEKQKKSHREKIRAMKDPTMVIDLYYCGTLVHPERIQDILKNGFSEIYFTAGEFGKGLYFSKFPSKAAQFSSLGKLLKAEVGIGKVETALKQNRTRIAPQPGHDSIITPGRLTHRIGEGDATMNQEYVIFDTDQALPLCLLSYETS